MELNKYLIIDYVSNNGWLYVIISLISLYTKKIRKMKKFHKYLCIENIKTFKNIKNTRPLISVKSVDILLYAGFDWI